MRHILLRFVLFMAKTKNKKRKAMMKIYNAKQIIKQTTKGKTRKHEYAAGFFFASSGEAI